MDSVRSSAGHGLSTGQLGTMDRNRNFTQNLNQCSINSTIYRSTQGQSQFLVNTVYTSMQGQNLYYSNNTNSTSRQDCNNNSQFSDFQRRVMDKVKNKTSLVRQVCDRSRGPGVLRRVVQKCKKKLIVPESKQKLNVPDCQQSQKVPDCQQSQKVPDCQQSLKGPDSKQSLKGPDSKQSLEVQDSKQSLKVQDCQQSLKVPECKQSLEVQECKQSLEVQDSKQSLKVQDCQQSLKVQDCQQSLKVPECKQSLEVQECKQSLEVQDCQQSLKVPECKQSLEVQDSKQSLKVPECKPNPVAPLCKQNLVAQVCKRNLIPATSEQMQLVESVSDTRIVNIKRNVHCLDINNNIITKDEEPGKRTLELDKRTVEPDSDLNSGEEKERKKVTEDDNAEAGVKETTSPNEDQSIDDHSEDYVSVGQKAVVFCLLCKCHVARPIFPLHLKGRKHTQMKEVHEKDKGGKIGKDGMKPSEKGGSTSKGFSGEVLTKKLLTRRIDENIKSPIRQYSREELLELQNAPASRPIPDSLEKDFIVDGIWNAEKFNAFHKGMAWNCAKNPRKRPAELLRDILQEQGILGKRRKLEQNATKSTFRVEGEVPTDKEPFNKRIGEKVTGPVRQYTREELLELQNAPASRCIPDSLEKDFIVDGIWNAAKFNAFHKGVSWNAKNPRKRPAEFLKNILHEEGILEQRKKKQEIDLRKAEKNVKTVRFELPPKKYPLINFVPQMTQLNPSPHDRVYHFGGDSKAVEQSGERYTVLKSQETSACSHKKCMRSVTKLAETEFKEEVIIVDSDDDDAVDKGGIGKQHKSGLEDPEVIVIDSEDSTETDSQDPLDKTVKTIYCTVCKSHVDSENWPRHMRGKRHRLKRKKRMDSRRKQNLFKVCIDQLRKQAEKRKHEYRSKRENLRSGCRGLQENERRNDKKSSSECVRRHGRKRSKTDERRRLREKHERRRSAERKSCEKDSNSHYEKASSAVAGRSRDVFCGREKVDECRASHINVTDAKTEHYIEMTKESEVDSNGLVHVINPEDDYIIQKECSSDQVNTEIAYNLDSDYHSVLIATPYIPTQTSEYTPPKKACLQSELPVSSTENEKSDMDTQDIQSNHDNVFAELPRPVIIHEDSVTKTQASLSSENHGTKCEFFDKSNKSRQLNINMNESTLLNGGIITLEPIIGNVSSKTKIDKTFCNNITKFQPDISKEFNGISNSNMQECTSTNIDSTLSHLSAGASQSEVSNVMVHETSPEVLSNIPKLSSTTDIGTNSDLIVSRSQTEFSNAMNTQDPPGIETSKSSSNDLSTRTGQKGEGSDEGTNDTGNTSQIIVPTSHIKTSLVMNTQELSGIKDNDSDHLDFSVPEVQKEATSDAEVSDSSVQKHGKIKTASDSNAVDPGSDLDSSIINSEAVAIPATGLNTDIFHKDHNCVAVFPWGVDRNTEMLELHHNIGCKLAVKIHIPEEKYPWVNYSERLHGLISNILKHIQHESGCQIQLKSTKSVLHQNEGIYSGVPEKHHILIESYGVADIAFAKLAVAVRKIKDFMNSIKQKAVHTLQMKQQMTVYNPQNNIGFHSKYHRYHPL
ncbi:uncharacterized protein LOC123541879 isoform X3 [Mercenaria mercenaria]|uniref:uncharacterized protein LOC123541879 isoform X3 n=1 Tax=Mercenaria mercenaria TaxID=6596 RepID=UPI00234F3395|nr:uncharacterized protein LOC123541879 isoform X3 [Mercenaria mercenaria]